MPQIHTKAFVISLQALLVGKKASGIPHSPWDILNNSNTHHHPVAICSRSQRNRFLSVQGVNAIQYQLWSKSGGLILAGNYMKTLASRLWAETAIGWRYYRAKTYNIILLYYYILVNNLYKCFPLMPSYMPLSLAFIKNNFACVSAIRGMKSVYFLNAFYTQVTWDFAHFKGSCDIKKRLRNADIAYVTHYILVINFLIQV